MITPTHHTLPSNPITSLAAFEAGGGLRGLEWARTNTPETIIDTLTAAGIRGRGGAGFPTGRKWSSLLASIDEGDDPFIVVNAAEGEPGTFKDRALLRTNPFVVLEGALIAAHALQARRVVVATKAAYRAELAAVRRSIDQLAQAGSIDDIEVVVVEGPDHYLFGEETALLEVIEGEDPLPRHLPPYDYGLFTTSPQMGWSAGVDESTSGPSVASSNPTLVNNVETYAHVALVCRNGADWYRTLGTHGTPGPTIVTLTGDVQRAVVAEVEAGHTLRTLIDDLGGGVEAGRTLKAVLSGVSNPVLTSTGLDVPFGHDELAAVGSGMGSAGFVVFDDTRNMIDVAYQVSMFLHVESCGQCNPCKTGTHDITAALEEIVTGRADATAVDVITRRLTTVTDGSRCYLPTQERRLIASLIEAFPDDLSIRLAGQPGDVDVPLPKLVDIVAGVAYSADRGPFKQPDWTYADTPVRLRTSAPKI